MSIRPGLHETLVTADVAEALSELDLRLAETDSLSEEEGAELLTQHLSALVLKALRAAESLGVLRPALAQEDRERRG